MIMSQLLQFFYKYRVFFIFLLLEIFSLTLVVNNRNHQAFLYFSAINNISGSIHSFTENIKDYFSLKKANDRLVAENALLRQELSNLKLNPELDTLIMQSFSITSAEVVNNSIYNYHNTITINKGSEDSIATGMGVINASGIVGKVKDVSQNFSTVVSLLNTDYLVSAQMGKDGALCTIKWDGRSPKYAGLLYIPRHLQPQKGDTVFTSGFNAIFPKNIPIGVLESISLSEEASFYDIKVELTVDFPSLDYVYIIKNEMKQEKDSLEMISSNE